MKQGTIFSVKTLRELYSHIRRAVRKCGEDVTLCESQGIQTDHTACRSSSAMLMRSYRYVASVRSGNDQHFTKAKETQWAQLRIVVGKRRSAFIFCAHAFLKPARTDRPFPSGICYWSDLKDLQAIPFLPLIFPVFPHGVLPGH